jgi:hypothetical protein
MGLGDLEVVDAVASSDKTLINQLLQSVSERDPIRVIGTRGLRSLMDSTRVISFDLAEKRRSLEIPRTLGIEFLSCSKDLGLPLLSSVFIERKELLDYLRNNSFNLCQAIFSGEGIMEHQKLNVIGVLIRDQGIEMH